MGQRTPAAGTGTDAPRSTLREPEAPAAAGDTHNVATTHAAPSTVPTTASSPAPAPAPAPEKDIETGAPGPGPVETGTAAEAANGPDEGTDAAPATEGPAPADLERTTGSAPASGVEDGSLEASATDDAAGDHGATGAAGIVGEYDGTENKDSPDAENPGAPGASGAPESSRAETAQPAPVREHKIVTVVPLLPHAGGRTLHAALESRARSMNWIFRTGGPGLTRAAFAGLLEECDALVLVSPADPAITATLGEKLDWLEANGRTGMPERTIVVVNVGTSERGELVLPADLDRPLVLLPFDPALSLPHTRARAPRRAARHALDQLLDELTTILQEH